MNAVKLNPNAIIAIPCVRICKNTSQFKKKNYLSFKIMATSSVYKRTFLGKCSTQQTIANGMIPQLEMNSTNDKQTIGTHANSDKLNPIKSI